MKIAQCIFTVSLFVYSILAFFNANKCWQIFGRVKYITNTSNACKLKSVIGGVGVSCSGQGCGVYRQILNTMKVIVKVKKISGDSMDFIPSPSPSVKIQITGRKNCFGCKSKTLHCFQKFVDNSQPCFQSIIWIFSVACLIYTFSLSFSMQTGKFTSSYICNSNDKWNDISNDWMLSVQM